MLMLLIKHFNADFCRKHRQQVELLSWTWPSEKTEGLCVLTPNSQRIPVWLNLHSGGGDAQLEQPHTQQVGSSVRPTLRRKPAHLWRCSGCFPPRRARCGCGPSCCGWDGDRGRVCDVYALKTFKNRDSMGRLLSHRATEQFLWAGNTTVWHHETHLCRTSSQREEEHQRYKELPTLLVNGSFCGFTADAAIISEQQNQPLVAMTTSDHFYWKTTLTADSSRHRRASLTRSFVVSLLWCQAPVRWIFLPHDSEFYSAAAFPSNCLMYSEGMWLRYGW